MTKTRLKRTGLASLALGALALLACELPLVLAVVGLGSLSAAAKTLEPTQSIELMALVLVCFGSILLLLHLVRTRKSQE